MFTSLSLVLALFAASENNGHTQTVNSKIHTETTGVTEIHVLGNWMNEVLGYAINSRSLQD